MSHKCGCNERTIVVSPERGCSNGCGSEFTWLIVLLLLCGCGNNSGCGCSSNKGCCCTSNKNCCCDPCGNNNILGGNNSCLTLLFLLMLTGSCGHGFGC